LAVKALAVLLAVLGGLLIAAGVGLIYLPAGAVVGGLELLGGAYVAAQLVQLLPAKKGDK